jgi:non-specific serine/threonine protein kinase/serine/threonine-protein kinase
MKALEKDRTRRYASPAELAADINRFRKDEPIVARPPSAVYRIGKYVRRHKLGVTAGTLILIALVAGIAVGTAGLIRALRAENRLLEEVATANHVVTFLESLFTVSNPSASRGDS